MAAQNAEWPRLALVGPLPPPAGGMANQCEQLARLLRADGATVEVVRTNSPYRPAWVARLRGLRAGIRLLPFLSSLWGAIGRAEVVHVMANSGLSWHLLAWPTIVFARWRGRPVIINYRGGHADEFFRTGPAHVMRNLRRVEMRVAPSGFLQRVFTTYGLPVRVIPNIIDLSRFRRRPLRAFGAAPHLIVTRNLEPIYGVDTALRAFARLRQAFPGALLTVAGQGPQLAALQRLCEELGVSDAVRFAGGMDNARMAALYADADCLLNASSVDNMPISLLEAFASNVPVVSTAAGGIPDLVDDGRTGLLVPVGDATTMADKAVALLRDPQRQLELTDNAAEEVGRYAWAEVGRQWRQAYGDALAAHGRRSGDAA